MSPVLYSLSQGCSAVCHAVDLPACLSRPPPADHSQPSVVSLGTSPAEAWRKAGLEWAYRLKEEPKRMFGRYVIGNTVFLGRAINLKLKTQEGDV